MRNSCSIIPRVRNNKGEIVDSRLYTDLLSLIPFNRDEVSRIYRITKGNEFIDRWIPELELDDNNEPTLRSLLAKTNLGTIVDEEKLYHQLNLKIGHYKRGFNRPAMYIKTPENYRKLSERAYKFNTTSPFRDKYVARVIDIFDNESDRIFYGIHIERKNRKVYDAIKNSKLEYNERLNERLRKILAEKGISIGALTELERRLGINGVTDFEQAKVAANGLIELIRLAEGIEGEKVLPEEFSHFAIEALNENPLVKRLINLIIDKDLAREIIGNEYNDYSKLYNDDPVKLAKEAAGKLLAEHLLKAVDIPANKPYKGILRRVIDAIKDFFKKLSANSIQRAILQVNDELSTMADELLNGDLSDDIHIESITSSDTYFNLNERVNRDRKLLQSIIDNELKRLKIYESRTINPGFNQDQANLIRDLENSLRTNNEIDGIYEFVDNAASVLKQLDDKLLSINNIQSLNERAKVLRDIRNYYYSYSRIVADIKKVLGEERLLTDNRYGDRVKVVIDQVSSLLDDVKVDYDRVSMPIFVSFIKPFVGEGIEVPFGKYKGKIIKAEDLVNVASEDISFFDRWLDSMADSSDYMLKILDQAVKKAKFRARLRTIELSKKIKAVGIELEQAGVKGFEWMYEKDDNGNSTGYYISEINFRLYQKKYREALQEISSKFEVGTEEFSNALKRWVSDNTETREDGTVIPRRFKDNGTVLYANKEFIELTGAKRKFYDTFMSIKGELDELLPPNYTSKYNTIKIRKDLIERVKSSDSVSSGAKQLWESVKDQFIRRCDDNEFGDKAGLRDFEDKEVQLLPIYYTRLRKGETNDDVSTDAVSTLIAYAAMANDFSEMNSTIDLLELSRDYLRDNLDIQSVEGGKKVTEKFKVLGRKVERAVFKPRDNRRIIERLNDFFEMQVYGRYMADEGTFGKSNIDKAKVANFANNLTALNTLAINALSGISNVATGTVMMNIEAIAGEYFKAADLIKADSTYGSALPEYLAEIGKKAQTSKLALWEEFFNVLQDYEQNVREVNFDRKGLFSRSFRSSTLYFTNNAGEHWMQLRTSLALAFSYKMKDPKGNIVSLWDAMEVVYTDPNNRSLGAELRVKEGYTKENGEKFTNEDAYKFTRKTAFINERLHGIYNQADKSAFQRLAIGRMAIMFRKWIKPALNRRFKSATYNFDAEAWTEGYYETTRRFLWQTVKELKEGKFAIIANYKSLDKREKKNIMRAIAEVGQLVLIMMILGLMEWPDDKKRPYYLKLIEYQLRRLYTEIGAMTPTFQMVKEAGRILKSPAAGIDTIEDTLGLVGLLNPYNYEFMGDEDAILKSGRYKDHTKAYKLFFNSPVIPLNRTIYRVLHPEEAIPFYK